MSQEKNLELAKVFGGKPFIVNSKYIAKSIRDLLNKIGKTVLLFEGGKSLALDDFVIKTGVDGTLNVMRHLKMQSGQGLKTRKQACYHQKKQMDSGALFWTFSVAG